MIKLTFIAYLIIMAMIWTCQHPLFFCMLLIAASLATGIFMGAAMSKWAMYSLILIFLGGMMVVFIYTTTLSGNEKFFICLSPLTPLLPATVLALSQFNSYHLTSTSSQMSLLYLPPSLSIVSFLMGFLLAVLFISVKISESFKGSLTKFY